MTRQTIFTAAALLTLATGCANRQRTAGEAMLDSSPPAKPAPVAQAPAAPATPSTPAAVATPATPVTPAIPATTATDPSPAATVPAVANAYPRDWKPVTALYQNGNVVAGPTYRLLPPPPATNRDVDVYFSDYYGTLLAVPQQIFTPFWMLITPPLYPVTYRGVEFPPSQTLDNPSTPNPREKVPGVYQIHRD